jgi:hypothetical protein
MTEYERIMVKLQLYNVIGTYLKVVVGAIGVALVIYTQIR